MFYVIMILGNGKIVQGLLYPCFHRNYSEATVFISAVKENEKWKKCRECHSVLKSKLLSYEGEVVLEEEWILSNDDESFTNFIKRCLEAKKPGIWVYSDDEMLRDAVEKSFVIGTCVGIDNYNDLLCSLSRLNVPDLVIYAFENKPTDIKKISNLYRNLSVINCPIDRVVVSRDFNPLTGTVTVRLGLDPSESILIYDKQGIWSSIMNAGNDSHLIITDNSELLKFTLTKKFFGKNTIHKASCQLAALNKDPQVIANLPLCKVIKPEDVDYLKETIKPICFAIVVDIFSKWSTTFSEQSCVDIFNELVEYSQNSLSTVVNDKSDTIGRIIHLSNAESAKQDLDSLLSSLTDLKNGLLNTVTTTIFSILSDEMGDLTPDDLYKKIDDLIQVISRERRK